MAGAELHGLARDLYGRRTARLTLVVLLSNWFWLYSASRTLVNTTEACILVLAVRAWVARRRVAAVAVFALAAAIRPTSSSHLMFSISI